MNVCLTQAANLVATCKLLRTLSLPGYSLQHMKHIPRRFPGA
jgi:hypothetical protein